MKKRIAAYCFVVIFSIGLPMRSQALIPTTDFANLIESLLGNIQELFSWLEEQAMMELEMELESALFGEQTDANNQATARMVVSLNKAQQDIQNLEIQREFAPAESACSTITIRDTLDDIYCASDFALEESRSRLRENHLNFNQTTQQQSEHIATVAAEIVEDCQPEEEGEPSDCLLVGMLFGDMPDGSSRAEIERTSLATERQIELITGGIPSRKTDVRMIDSASGNAMRIGDYRREALKGMAQESLLAVRGAFVTQEGAPGSELEALWEFVNKRWSDDDGEFIKLITNTHPDKSDEDFTTTPSQVLREMAVMEVFQSYMDVLNYEQSLREEALTAAMLSIEVEPLIGQPIN